MTVLRSSPSAHVTSLLSLISSLLLGAAVFIFTFCQDRFPSSRPVFCFSALSFPRCASVLSSDEMLPFLPCSLPLLHALLPVSSSFWYLSMLASCSPDVALTSQLLAWYHLRELKWKRPVMRGKVSRSSQHT